MKKTTGATWDSIFLAFSRVLTILCSMLTTKILSTGLSLEGYGTYAQASLIISTGTSIIIFGMGDALAYYFNRSNDEIEETLRSRIINTIFFIEIALGLLLASIIVFGQTAIVSYFSNESLYQVIIVTSILPLFSNIINLLQILCVSSGRAKWMSIYSLVLAIVRIAVALLAVYVLENILWIFVGTLLIDVCHIVVYNMDIHKKSVHINVFKISYKHIKPIFAYGLPMGVYSITSSLTRDIDKLVIGRIGGTEELAIYTNCSKVLPLDFFVTAFAMVLIPYIYRRVSEGRKEESIDLFSSYLKVGYYTVWMLGTMVLVAPEAVISFLYADVYVNGKWVFILYVLDSMLRFASVHLILTAAGKAKNVMLYSVISLILNAILNIIFYHIWGMVGPAIATTIVSFIYTILILGDTIKTIEAKWKDVFDFKDIVIFVTTIVASWGVSFALNALLLHFELHPYVAMIISMCIFAAIVLTVYFKKIFRVLKKINSFKL